jgi:phenylalanyl-tRNA synthetase beta chain
MKASYNWLRALVPNLNAVPAELAERLTRAGLEVEAITEYGEGTKALVVAEVKALEPHPTRAKLRLVTVDRGDGITQRIVCGAPNVPDPGGLVCLAPLGSYLPAVGMTLTPREIAGVVSEGMLCSEGELGLTAAKKGEDDAGIIILPPGTAKPGTPLREAVPAMHDYIFEIGVTPNRPDALGHIGIAREAAALFNLPFQSPDPGSPLAVDHGSIETRVKVTVEDTERCPHYGAAMVTGVVVGPSPMWLKYRLESLGMRSISNVVDVTNLVMLEHGHPMHAFDLARVRGTPLPTINVRRARAGEPMKTLDGVDRTLTEDDLVITDGEGPTALAGIMGGADSEIRDTTTNVLLEVAYFAPRGVRRSSRRHGLHTESSHRFERGVDPADIPEVLANAAGLLTRLAKGKAVPGLIVAGAPLAPPRLVPFTERRMRALLGMDVSFEDATKILARLGCSVRSVHGEPGDARADVVVPTFRPDLGLEADLIEEVVRVLGIDAVPTVLPAIRPMAPRASNDLMARVRRAAIDVGLSEAITYGFVSSKELAAVGAPEATVKLINPLTEDRSVMRTSLLPGLLEALGRARRHGVSDVRMFTVGARFLPGDKLPDEVPSFAAVLAGARTLPLAKSQPLDVYDAKGAAVEIVERALGASAPVTVAHLDASDRPAHLHPRAAGAILVGGARVGTFGPLHPEVIDALDLGAAALVIEIDVRALSAVGAKTPQYKPIPTLPASTRDIAVTVSDEVFAGGVGDAIREVAGDLCESVDLFDLYRGDGIPAGKKSLAFHVVYRDPKAATDPDKARTLTDDEVDQRHKAVEKAVKDRFGAELRA